MNLSSNTFRLVWTNATSEDDPGEVFEVIGSRESIWALWYIIASTAQIKTLPKVYSLDGRLQNPRNGLMTLKGINEYLPFKDKNRS